MKLNQDCNYFSIHSIKSIESKGFSIVLANVENTLGNTKLAKKTYNENDFYFEYHNQKKDLKWVMK